MFKMNNSWSFNEMTANFMDIINQLKALGKLYTNARIVRKIITSLPRVWRSKVTTIQEAKDRNTLSLNTFIGSLKTHEIKLIEARSKLLMYMKMCQREGKFWL